MSDAEYVKELLQKSLPPPSIFFEEAFMSAPLMEIMVLEDIGVLYGFGKPDASFIIALSLGKDEAVSNLRNVTVWIT